MLYRVTVVHGGIPREAVVHHGTPTWYTHLVYLPGYPPPLCAELLPALLDEGTALCAELLPALLSKGTALCAELLPALI